MDVQQMIEKARDTMWVKRVYGEPYEKNGITFIPAARLGGAGGGGEGEAGNGAGPETGKGSGGGFGLLARPAGAFVIKGETVRWQPAVDANKVILGAQVVAVVAFLTLRALIKARSRARAAEE